MATRTFLALDVNETIRSALIQAQRALADCGAALRPVAQNNLHVTLQFLGDVADDRLREVMDAASQAAGKIEPFDFYIRGLLAVPPKGELRMVWAVAEDPTGRMKQLAESLAEALGSLGFRHEERSFAPHITLVRIKSAENPARFRRSVEQFGATDFGLQHAQELTVYASQLTPTGPVYTAVHRSALGRQGK